MVLCRCGFYNRRRRIDLALDARGLSIGDRAFDLGYGRLHRGAGSYGARIRTRGGGAAGNVLLFLLRTLLLLSLLLLALLLFPLLLIALLLLLLLRAFLLVSLLLVPLLLPLLFVPLLLLLPLPLLLVSLLLLLLLPLLLLLLLIGLPKLFECRRCPYYLMRNGDQRKAKQEHSSISRPSN